MRETKAVTIAEFKRFLESYPFPLDRDVYGAFEPPLVTFNDFRLGMWPESVVAWHYLDENNWHILKELP